MIWTALWVAWGLAFVGIEGAALRNDNPDGTLSVHLRRWFKVDTHLGRRCLAYRARRKLSHIAFAGAS